MFNSQLRIYGKHARILKKYSRDKQAAEQVEFLVRDHEGRNRPTYIFETMIQCYMVAAMVGIIEHKKIENDEGIDNPANIFTDVLHKNRNELDRIVKFMILTDDSTDDIDLKIKQAFSVKRKDKIEDGVTSYARYGLEVIDDYFKDCRSNEDVANALRDFRDHYHFEN